MAKKIINTKDISREEWLEIRRNSIGGSDSASACGASPWKSPLELYCEKDGLITDKESNEAMRRGVYLEEYVAQRFEEESGKKVRRDNHMYADDDFPCLTANIDRVIVGENAGLECKTMNDYSSNDYDIEEGEIPTQYYYQLQHYMMVMHWQYMYIAFSSNFKFVWLRVERNDEFIRDMRQKELDFWYNYVVKKQRPECDGSDSAIDTLTRLYPNETPGTVLEFDFDSLGERYTQLTDIANHIKAEKENIKSKICDTLMDAEVGLSAGYKASWKAQTKESMDTKRFKKDHPDLYERYKTTSTSRVFRLAEIKKGR